MTRYHVSIDHRPPFRFYSHEVRLEADSPFQLYMAIWDKVTNTMIRMIACGGITIMIVLFGQVFWIKMLANESTAFIVSSCTLLPFIIVLGTIFHSAWSDNSRWRDCQNETKYYSDLHDNDMTIDPDSIVSEDETYIPDGRESRSEYKKRQIIAVYKELRTARGISWLRYKFRLYRLYYQLAKYPL